MHGIHTGEEEGRLILAVASRDVVIGPVDDGRDAPHCRILVHADDFFPPMWVEDSVTGSECSCLGCGDVGHGLAFRVGLVGLCESVDALSVGLAGWAMVVAAGGGRGEASSPVAFTGKRGASQTLWHAVDIALVHD